MRKRRPAHVQWRYVRRSHRAASKSSAVRSHLHPPIQSPSYRHLHAPAASAPSPARPAQRPTSKLPYPYAKTPFLHTNPSKTYHLYAKTHILHTNPSKTSHLYAKTPFLHTSSSRKKTFCVAGKGHVLARKKGSVRALPAPSHANALFRLE